MIKIRPRVLGKRLSSDQSQSLLRCPLTNTPLTGWIEVAFIGRIGRRIVTLHIPVALVAREAPKAFGGSLPPKTRLDWHCSVQQYTVNSVASCHGRDDGLTEWIPDLSRRGTPRYLAIADAIAGDIEAGRLSPSDRLPPQRTLAAVLGIDFTTVARGYVEAKRRGLIESRVGQGTFVSDAVRRRHPAMARHPEIVDLSMNLPPEPDDPELLDRMQDGWEAISRDLVLLMRYQGFGGVSADKEAASAWLSRRGLVPQQDRVFIVPGAHPALVGILGLLARPGDVVLSEAITYPGARSIAGQLGLSLIGLPMDDEGVDADAFAAACARLAPKALYLNPTLLNPTTHTISGAAAAGADLDRPPVRRADHRGRSVRAAARTTRRRRSPRWRRN